jgi:hypothetical protein
VFSVRIAATATIRQRFLIIPKSSWRGAMLFDPDAGKTIEEIIQHTWEHKITPAKRAEILAIAEAAGCTCAANDRITGPRLKARWDFQAAPFGKDPRVTA